MKNHILIMTCLAVALSGCETLQDHVADLGFIPVPWPSTEYKPGTVVEPLPGPHDTQQVSIVCGYTDYVGSPPISEDNGASLSAASNLSGTFKLDASYQDKISGEVDLSVVQNTSVSLTNVHIDVVSNAEVFSGLSKQSSGCTQAIQNAEANHTNMGFLKEAIRGDVTFTVDFKGTAALTADAKQGALKNLAGTLNGQITVGPNSTSITGKDLYVGILKPDSTLVKTPSVAYLQRSFSAYQLTPNRSNVPCAGRSLCSPDGKWLEAETDINLSVASGHTLRDAVAQCSDGGSGMCAFQSPSLYEYSQDHRSVKAKIFTYSGPVNIRVSAEEWGPP